MACLVVWPLDGSRVEPGEPGLVISRVTVGERAREREKVGSLDGSAYGLLGTHFWEENFSFISWS